MAAQYRYLHSTPHVSHSSTVDTPPWSTGSNKHVKRSLPRDTCDTGSPFAEEEKDWQRWLNANLCVYCTVM